MLPKTRGLYFEEFEVGNEFSTPARTITEADIVNFAGISGDFNYIHINAEAAKATPYRARIAHGMLIASIATGLCVQEGFIEGTTMAFRELSWKFSAPVFIGDTIYVKVTVASLKAMPRMGGGLVNFDARVINQRNELAQRGKWKMLMQSRETVSGAKSA